MEQTVIEQGVGVVTTLAGRDPATILNALTIALFLFFAYILYISLKQLQDQRALIDNCTKAIEMNTNQTKGMIQVAEKMMEVMTQNQVFHMTSVDDSRKRSESIRGDIARLERAISELRGDIRECKK